ncbi:MAG: carbonic anhydrase [Myxococcales bacterium]|nr:carbonic anhydrase [Myxococcales bacterium]
MIDQLLRGNRSFRESYHAENRALYARLSQGQAPATLFITCSDSRVGPERFTGADAGELFVLRNAGNLVPPCCSSGGGDAATIEYAVDVLGVRDIVVCGHSDCGAMKGLLDPASAAHLPRVSAWLAQAESSRRRVSDDGEGRLARTIEHNVLQQLDNLRTHPCVAGALARNAIELHGWVYDIGSGAIRQYDPACGDFVEAGPQEQVEAAQ